MLSEAAQSRQGLIVGAKLAKPEMTNELPQSASRVVLDLLSDPIEEVSQLRHGSLLHCERTDFSSDTASPAVLPKPFQIRQHYLPVVSHKEGLSLDCDFVGVSECKVGLQGREGAVGDHEHFSAVEPLLQLQPALHLLP